MLRSLRIGHNQKNLTGQDSHDCHDSLMTA
jgi:hypothetical protein